LGFRDGAESLSSKTKERLSSIDAQVFRAQFFEDVIISTRVLLLANLAQLV